MGHLRGAIWSIAASRDGDLIVATSAEGDARLWSIADARSWDIPLPDGPAGRVSLGDDGTAYVSSGETLRAWRRPSGPDQPMIAAGSHTARGRVTASGSYAWNHGFGGIQVVDLSSDVAHQIDTPGGIVFAFAVSADERRFAAGTADGLVRTIDPSSGEVREAHRMEALVDAVAFSPDGTVVAAGDETGQLVTIDLGSGAVRAFTGHDTSIKAIAFSPDGELIATGDTRGGLRVWRADGGGVAVLPEHATRVFDVSFAGDRSILTLSADGQARVWTVSDELIPTQAAALDAWLTSVTTAEVDDDGRLRTPTEFAE